MTCLRRGAWLLLSLAITLPAPAAEVDTDKLLEQWFSSRADLKTWQAEVTQVRALKSLTQPLTTPGRVWFSVPNSFRWELGDPAQTIAIRQPRQMLVIYPQLKRVERFPIQAAERGAWEDTLSLLETGFPKSRKELEKRFAVLEVTVKANVATLNLKPTTPGAAEFMPRVLIQFDATTLVLKATELQFADGSTMRNEFKKVVQNPVLKKEQFNPKLDPEYKIIKAFK